MEIHAWQEGRLTGMSVDLKKIRANLIVENFSWIIIIKLRVIEMVNKRDNFFPAIEAKVKQR